MIKNIDLALNLMYPFFSFIISVFLAQLAKPFIMYLTKGKFNLRYFFASGGLPSSHSAGVVALATATGIQEKFSSTIFAVTCAFAFIVMYDAANVRYYAGKNIELTKQIIKDIKKEKVINLEDEIYDYPIKEVLGHKWSEVISGTFLGIFVAIFVLWIRG